jgi:ketosteroid isomerase-like protein
VRHTEKSKAEKMRQILKNISILAFAFIVCLNCFSQEPKGQNIIEEQLKDVVDRWYTSIGRGDLNAFKSLLTDDFQLLAFGRRYDKEQIVELAKDFSDIKYNLSHIRSGSGSDLAYLTFDVRVDCKLKGEATTGYAMEAYLFRKISNQWKVHTKTVVMIEATNPE